MSKLLSMMMSSSGGGGQIEYLQSDGAIYIPLCESGETLNVKRFVIDFACFDDGSVRPTVILGRYYNYHGDFTYSYGIVGANYAGAFCVGIANANGHYNDQIAQPYSDRRTIDYSFSAVRSFDDNCGLFGGYSKTSATPLLVYSKSKIWSCILYDGNGNEVANLLPKEENGVLGMYDSVRNKFIAGVGSGSFIAG